MKILFLLLVPLSACATIPANPCPDGPAESWSSDFLVNAVIAGECPERSDDFRGEYLRRLGIVDRAPSDRDKLFRGLVAEEPAFNALKAKLKGVSGTPGEILKRAYGSAQWVKDIVILGATAKEAAAIEKTVSELCPSMPCPFWDPKSLYKVVVTPLPKAAAYLPELAQVVLSKDLLGKPMVVAHELAHVAVASRGLAAQKEFATEEVLADHVALFRYHPERFCLVDKRAKFDWVRQNFFPSAPTLKCP